MIGEVRHKLNTRGNDSLRIHDLKSAPASCPSNPKLSVERGSSVSADWPRGLIILITFLTVLTMFVWGAIENNRNPNSERLKDVTISFVVLYAVFLVVARVFE